jgi:hypothetical protein
MIAENPKYLRLKGLLKSKTLGEKMAKNRPERKDLSKKNNPIREGEKADIDELAKSLESLTAFVCAQPRPIWGRIFENNEEGKRLVGLALSTIYKVLDDEKKSDTLITKILSEIIMGAYQDRMVVYSSCPSGPSADSTEAMESFQRIRHKADLHLIRVIQAFKDINRPLVKVIVKQADQVNVGEKQMNVDKQVNISTDLDKK